MLVKGTRKIMLTFSIAFSYAVLTASKIKVGLTSWAERALNPSRKESKRMEQILFLWTKPAASINAKTDPIVLPQSAQHLSNFRYDCHMLRQLSKVYKVAL